MEYAECGICSCGQLLPFTSPEGYTMYFCTSCRARFSGYQEEPFYQGVPIFAEMAHYTYRDSGDQDQAFTRGRILDSYRELLEEYPPPESEQLPTTARCTSSLLENADLMDASWLPEV
ncbi:MAG: hypothetical protein R6V01_00100 [Thermoplasmatota archaeon]